MNSVLTRQRLSTIRCNEPRYFRGTSHQRDAIHDDCLSFSFRSFLSLFLSHSLSLSHTPPNLLAYVRVLRYFFLRSPLNLSPPLLLIFISFHHSISVFRLLTRTFPTLKRHTPCVQTVQRHTCRISDFICGTEPVKWYISLADLEVKRHGEASNCGTRQSTGTPGATALAASGALLHMDSHCRYGLTDAACGARQRSLLAAALVMLLSRVQRRKKPTDALKLSVLALFRVL